MILYRIKWTSTDYRNMTNANQETGHKRLFILVETNGCLNWRQNDGSRLMMCSFTSM